MAATSSDVHTLLPKRPAGVPRPDVCSGHLLAGKPSRQAGKHQGRALLGGGWTLNPTPGTASSSMRLAASSWGIESIRDALSLAATITLNPEPEYAHRELPHALGGVVLGDAGRLHPARGHGVPLHALEPPVALDVAGPPAQHAQPAPRLALQQPADQVLLRNQVSGFRTRVRVAGDPASHSSSRLIRSRSGFSVVQGGSWFGDQGSCGERGLSADRQCWAVCVAASAWGGNSVCLVLVHVNMFSARGHSNWRIHLCGR